MPDTARVERLRQTFGERVAPGAVGAAYTFGVARGRKMEEGT